jgi:hypothetical protein
VCSQQTKGEQWCCEFYFRACAKLDHQLLYRQRYHDRSGWSAGIPNGFSDTPGEDLRHAAIQDRRSARRMEGLRLVPGPAAETSMSSHTRGLRYLYASDAFCRLRLGVLSTATHDSDAKTAAIL